MSTINRVAEQDVTTPIPPAAQAPPVWNSLEVCKLVIGALIPITVLLASYQFTVHQDARHTSDQKALADSQRDAAFQDERIRTNVNHRIDVWDRMAPEMNAIYSYFLYVGDWKALKAADIIAKKRKLDDLMYSNRIFFTDDFFYHYTAFMKAAYRTDTGWRHDPELKTVNVRKQDVASKVQFGKCDNSDAVYKAYWDFQDQSGVELNLPPFTRGPRPDKPEEAKAPPCLQ